MKVAILHDWMTTLGGGEKVVLTLADAIGAEVVTAEANPSVARNAGFDGVRVRSLGSLPQGQPWRQVAASRAFGRLDLEDVDVTVLSGNWTVHAARRNHPSVFYCYTPTRVFYDLRSQWLRELPWPQRPLARAWSFGHRRWNEKALRHVDRIVTSCHHVQDRIRRFWRRDSLVVYPPIPVARYRFEGVGDFWLNVSRLSHEKRLDLAVEAFRRSPTARLVIVGGAPPGTNRDAFVRKLRPPPNVEFLDTVPDAELLRLYATCRGVLSTAADEDFGMTAVEANASGKVLVAADGGGFRETQVEGVTAFLLPPRPDAFARTIQALTTSDLEGRTEVCKKQALKFDAVNFVERMKTEITSAAEGARP